MFVLKIENANGEIFELTHNMQNYAVIGIQGLTPPPTAVNTSTGGAIDGTFYNSSRVNQRNIVIDIVLNGDIETNRQQLYNIFNLKKPCTIYFQNANRNVKIVGYVEVLEGDLFSQREQMQISIICPRPYFEDMNTIYTELSYILRMFQFPFSIAASNPIPFSEIVGQPLCTIVNSGATESGCVMTVTFSKIVEGLTIYNTTTQTYFGLNRMFYPYSTLTINTMSGQMSVSVTENGITDNLLNQVTAGSSWFKLAVGENNFTYTATSNADGVQIVFASTNLYGGV